MTFRYVSALLGALAAACLAAPAAAQAPPDVLDDLWFTVCAQAGAGTALPFATLDAASGRAIGTTRFGAIDRANRHVEIGWTYLARRYHRTGANSEAKLLMLAHAFEAWGCLRVEFKTDSLNTPTRTALARLGATEEGTFRNHMVCASGRIRHSVYFSITAEEWPAVKARLAARVAAGGHTA